MLTVSIITEPWVISLHLAPPPDGDSRSHRGFCRRSASHAFLSGGARLADAGGARLWRIDPKADYGAFNALAADRINTKLI
jgi:hypothetical protein